MTEWQTVAEGINLTDLEAVVADMQLPKGTKMKVVIDLTLPLGWAFDVVGAEWIFQPFVPAGMELVDVYGKGSQGIVEMEADPAWLVAVIAFIKAHWLAITIAGFALALIIAFITVLVKVPASYRGGSPKIILHRYFPCYPHLSMDKPSVFDLRCYPIPKGNEPITELVYVPSYLLV
ncbi:unnamed protein product [marine sediment metagenome]|uniref:Uncharacterized protein n=1 Tax=marine sediment metagenome TaxID=412755 RepID=X1MC46_9ZZZZ